MMSCKPESHRHGDGVPPGRPRRGSLRNGLLALLLGLSLPVPAGAAELVDLVVVRVTRGDGAVREVVPSCLLGSAGAVPPPLRARGASAQDFARRYLDQLERFDLQRAEAHAAALDELVESQEFLEAYTLAGELLMQGAVGDETALAEALTLRAAGVELSEGQSLEPLAAWVRDAEGESPRVLFDDQLWHALEDDRQGMVLVQLLAQLERSGGSGRAAEPCRLVTFLIAPDLPELGLSDYYGHLAGRNEPKPADDEAAEVEELIPKGGIRFDRLFNPMDEVVDQRKRGIVVDGYEVRKLGTVRWSATARVTGEQETSKSLRTGSNQASKQSSTAYGARAAVHFDGYVYHPRLLRFGLSAGIDYERSEYETSGTADTATILSDSLQPQFGLSALLFGSKPTSISFAFNKYLSRRQGSSDEYSVTDINRITIGVNWRNAVVPASFKLERSRADESERSSELRRIEDTLRFNAEAGHVSELSDTSLEYKYRDTTERRRSFAGLPILDAHRETHSLLITNGLRIKALDGRLESRLNWVQESGDRPSERLALSQRLLTRHLERLQGTYGWQGVSRSRPGDAKQDSRQESLSAYGSVGWTPTESLRVHGRAEIRRDDSTFFEREQTSISIGAHWTKRLGTFSFQLWGSSDWTTADESGRTGMRDVFDERHVLSAETTALLENPGVLLETIVVRSVDGAMTWVEDIDYQVEERGDFIELSRIETGTLPEGSIVSVDYTYELELSAPLSYDRTSLTAGGRISFRQHLECHASWKSLQYDLSDEMSEVARLQDESLWRVGLSGRWGRFSARIEQSSFDREDSSYTARRAGLDFRASFGGIHAVGVHLGWQDVDYRVGRDSTRYSASLSYSVNPGLRWPRLELVASARPYEDGAFGEDESFQGSPYSVSLGLDHEIGRLFLRATYSLERREIEGLTRNDQLFRIVLRRVW